jgi:hypothetical protein
MGNCMRPGKQRDEGGDPGYWGEIWGPTVGSCGGVKPNDVLWNEVTGIRPFSVSVVSNACCSGARVVPALLPALGTRAGKRCGDYIIQDMPRFALAVRDVAKSFGKNTCIMVTVRETCSTSVFR